MLLDGVVPPVRASLNSLPSGIEAGPRCGNQQAGDLAESDEAFLVLIPRCALASLLSKT
jgi:hypothetical protein